MYVRHGLALGQLLCGSWRVLAVIVVWSATVVGLHEFAGLRFIAIPVQPVTAVAIAVTLYLGFKTSSAYNRWWEARKIWGDIVHKSRSWTIHVSDLIHAGDQPAGAAVRRELVYRHLAWVNALAVQLRAAPTLRPSRGTHLFGARRVFEDRAFHQSPESYRRLLAPEEAEALARVANPAAHILKLQSARLGAAARDGLLDSWRHVRMMELLDDLFGCVGRCERIRQTPFPRQIARFARLFTWVFILLLPLSFMHAFEAEARFHHLTSTDGRYYAVAMIVFTAAIGWVFYVMERVSDSLEDPFAGAPTDVPVSSICRKIEIDLREMLGEADVPPPLEPIDGVLY